MIRIGLVVLQVLSVAQLWLNVFMFVWSFFRTRSDKYSESEELINLCSARQIGYIECSGLKLAGTPLCIGASSNREKAFELASLQAQVISTHLWGALPQYSGGAVVLVSGYNRMFKLWLTQVFFFQMAQEQPALLLEDGNAAFARMLCAAGNRRVQVSQFRIAPTCPLIMTKETECQACLSSVQELRWMKWQS
eukprot:TRINITY_DN10825_c0_g1_i3.p1 TRINITY_DN10825_c0_g1~~TRINITY_DN10825_c0_g1_i3.p1  ORF type:complete len:193 (-),score=35.73 TRINITY_DN10825_c0_g1_i3:198-776(-)